MHEFPPGDASPARAGRPREAAAGDRASAMIGDCSTMGIDPVAARPSIVDRAAVPGEPSRG